MHMSSACPQGSTPGHTRGICWGTQGYVEIVSESMNWGGEIHIIESWFRLATMCRYHGNIWSLLDCGPRNIPTLPWVRSRVWAKVGLGSGQASGEGWVGTWPVNRLRLQIFSAAGINSQLSSMHSTIPLAGPLYCLP